MWTWVALLALSLALAPMTASARDSFPIQEDQLPTRDAYDPAFVGFGVAIAMALLAQVPMMMDHETNQEAGTVSIGGHLGGWYAWWAPRLDYVDPSLSRVLDAKVSIDPSLLTDVGISLGIGPFSTDLSYLFSKLEKSVFDEAGADGSDTARALSVFRGTFGWRLGKKIWWSTELVMGRFEGGVRGMDYHRDDSGYGYNEGGDTPVNTRWYRGQTVLMFGPLAKKGSAAAGFGFRYAAYDGPAVVTQFEEDELSPIYMVTRTTKVRNYLAVLGVWDMERMYPHLFKRQGGGWFVGADLQLMLGGGTMENAEVGKVTSLAAGADADVHVGLNLGYVAISLGYKSSLMYNEYDEGGLQYDAESVTGVKPGHVLRILDIVHGPNLQVSASF